MSSGKRWDTVDTERAVLFVGRNLQATARLYYDVMPLLIHDTRVQVYFTIDSSTEFGDAVHGFLDREGAKLIPWRVATSDQFHCDLTVSASANQNLGLLPGKKLVMAHGAGHHKYRATTDGAESTVSGLSPSQLLVDGEVLPDAIALGGAEQVERLTDSCRQAAPRAVITGDVCAERLHASLPHRERYRHHLGLRRDQRLVVVSSTWGPRSLLARVPSLLDKLLAQLPANEYRVAFVLHPNSWDRHGRPQVHGWLRHAKRAGLTMVPAHEGWRASIVAADCVIGDHGSVSFYAADAGRPLLFGTFGDTEVPPDSPAARLRAVTPALNMDRDFGSQITSAIASHNPAAHQDITATALDTSHSPGWRMSQLLYRLLELASAEETHHPRPVPLPDVEYQAATTFHVHPVEENGQLSIAKYPLTKPVAALPTGDKERVLVVDAAEPIAQQRHAAAVMTWTEYPLSLDDADYQARNLLSDNPGARIGAIKLHDGGVLLRTQSGDAFTAHNRSYLDAAMVGAMAYIQTVNGQTPSQLRYRDGIHSISCDLKPHR